MPVVRRTNLPQLLRISAVTVGAVLALSGIILATHWPFTRRATAYSLERISSSEVHISRFHTTFFPHPGYIAENVVFTRNTGPGIPPLVRIQTVTCQASWFAVLSFTHRIQRMRLEGMHIFIPAQVPPAVRKDPAAAIPSTVAELVSEGATLEIASRHPGGPTLRFDFSRLTIEDVAKGKSMHFRTVLHNPKPPGDIAAYGAFGPLSPGAIGQTPVSGSFNLTHAELDSFHAIGGMLSAKGAYRGTLGRIEVQGQTDIPNFEVTRSSHRVHLAVKYYAIVNGMNGDVALQSAEAHLLGTVLSSRGSLTGEAGRRGKTLSLNIDSREGRVQDLFRLLVKADRPPLDGPIVFRAHVVLPLDRQPFLQRVVLEGEFGIVSAHFSNPERQRKVNELSDRARSKKKNRDDPDSEHIASDLKGHVVLRHGIAAFTNASFSVPGASARMQGTYNLITERVDLHGTLSLRASLSQAAGGIKALLLKPLNPLFRKNGAGAVLPLRITGTYSHPIFAVSLKKR